MKCGEDEIGLCTRQILKLLLHFWTMNSMGNEVGCCKQQSFVPAQCCAAEKRGRNLVLLPGLSQLTINTPNQDQWQQCYMLQTKKELSGFHLMNNNRRPFKHLPVLHQKSQYFISLRCQKIRVILEGFVLT